MIEILIFSLGLIIGSFLNVVVYRLPAGESIIYPGSHCPECKTRLAPLDLIPVISFLATKGRCRYCQTKISYQYPLVELLTAFLFLFLLGEYQVSFQLGTYLVLVSLLIPISIIDLQEMIIPNQITYGGLILGLVSSIYGNYISIIESLLGLLIPAGLLLVIALLGKMGLGDVKLVAMIGTFLGVRDTLLVIFCGSVVGSIIGLILIGLGNKRGTSKVPFGPFIALGTIVVLLWSEEIINFYLQLY
ncbi:prepilin peptidase [Halanaerobaculum tunisiense]